MGNATIGKGKIDAKYLIKAAIGIIIMLLGFFIPPVPPITEVGMQLLFEFIGLVFLWCLVDLIWPTFLAIVISGLNFKQIYTGSWARAGIYEAGQQSFGCFLAVFVIGVLLLSYALEKSGAIRRLCLFMCTRKIAKKSPWSFTLMILLSGFIIGLFLDMIAAQFFMFALLYEMFDLFGFEKGEGWPKLIIATVTISIVTAFSVTPICHPAPIMFINIYAGMTQQIPNLLGYMIVGIPIGVIIFILMCLFIRKTAKVDMSKLTAEKIEAVETLRPGPMTVREKWVVGVFVAVVACWLIPGFLSLFAAQSALYQTMAMLTDTSFLFIAIVFLCLIKIDGEPLLNIRKALQVIDWPVVVLLAGMMMVATAFGEQTTGIGAFLASNVAPIAAQLSPFMLVGLIGTICLVLTNLMNGIPIGVVFINVAVPISVNLGMNPFILTVCVSITSCLAFALPSACAPMAVAYGNTWTDGKTIFKNGLFTCIASIIICFLLMYPLSVPVLGA